MYTLARIFRVSLEQLRASNPHIPDPDYLVPQDVLCVPALMHMPCCVELVKTARMPFGSEAYAIAGFAPRGGQSLSVIATLPQPSYFGDYDIYIATAFFKGIGGFGNQLFPAPMDPPVWSTRIELPTVIALAPNVRITIQPSDSGTGTDSGVIFENTLFDCGCSLCAQGMNVGNSGRGRVDALSAWSREY